MKCTSVCGCFFFLVCLLLLLALTKDTVDAHNLRPPAKNFSRHKLVQPTVHHGRTKREISSTRDTSGDHAKEVTLKIDVDGEEYTLDLRLNEDLVTNNHVISYQKDGKTMLHKPKKKDLNICQYSGSVRGRPGSWVAVSTCHGVQGVIYDGEKMRYIQPAEGNHIMSQHYLYDHIDLVTEHRCGYDGGVTNNTEFDPMLTRQIADDKKIKASRHNRHKRSSEDTHVRGPFNANKASRYVELVLVADYMEYRDNGENLELVHHQLKDIANIINSVYSPLNIFIALVGVVVWNEGDQIVLEEDGDRTLKNFLEYRKTISRQIPNDNAQLLTRQKFKDGVVGKALKGPICTYAFSGSVATNHTEVIGLVAATMAHEMGHNFGMEHDTAEDCTCPDEKCIMSPSSTSVVPVHWSSCSLKSLALAFEKGMDYCLRNKPKRLYESPTCGNGFVEAGEQCDCGMTISREYNACQSCCHPETCLLRSNATCAMGSCCDLDSCRPKSAGTMCRSADRECDLPEYCTGHSEFCPDDFFKMDGIPCGKENEAFCSRGSCRSHTDQCRLLWGTTGLNSNERCYTQNNPKGNQNGNCGYDRINQVYHPCASEDVKCGLLQCRHLNERLEFGMESVATLSQIFINSQGSIIPCRTAIIDLGINDVDPGMVPDGAKCGENKMCMNHKCVPVDYVKAIIATKENSVCPSNCSGHGVCNSEGHCHCEPGFSPPLCALPGHGGSIDSGPSANPNIQRNFMITMYIIFLGIIPSCLLIMFLFYYSRHNNIWWKKPRKSYVHDTKSKEHGGGTSETKCTTGCFNISTKFPKLANSNPCSLRLSPCLARSDSNNSALTSDRDPNMSKGYTFDEKPVYANSSMLIKTKISENSSNRPSDNKPFNLDVKCQSIEHGSILIHNMPKTINRDKNIEDSTTSRNGLKTQNKDTKLINVDPVYCNRNNILSNLTASEPHIYATISEKVKTSKSNINLNSQISESNKVQNKFINFFEKGYCKKKDLPVKKFNRKINKDDIKVVDNTNFDEIKKFELQVNSKPNNETSEESKPKNNRKPNIEIIKTGLASTTNKMLSNTKGHHPFMRNITDSDTQTSVSERIANIEGFKK